MFGRHNFLASMVLPAFVSGIFHVKYRIFLAGAAVAGTLWIGGYVLVAYFIGPEVAHLIGDIGLKGILALAIIVVIGATVRLVWHRLRQRSQ
jgi:membrane protein DedA with SNARE-associated domain